MGKSQEKIEKEIEKLAKGIGGRVLNYSINKIEDVRRLEKFTRLSLSERTIIVAKDIDKSSVQALNAFLKNLEEPQENLTYILTAKSHYNLLPTIVSRCQIIKAEEGRKVDQETVKKAKEFLEAEPSEKLLVTDGIRNREEAIEFTEELILGLHKLIHSEKDNYQKCAQALISSQETRKALMAYGNVSLQLTKLAVNT